MRLARTDATVAQCRFQRCIMKFARQTAHLSGNNAQWGRLFRRQAISGQGKQQPVRQVSRTAQGLSQAYLWWPKARSVQPWTLIRHTPHPCPKYATIQFDLASIRKTGSSRPTVRMEFTATFEKNAKSACFGRHLRHQRRTRLGLELTSSSPLGSVY